MNEQVRGCVTTSEKPADAQRPRVHIVIGPARAPGDIPLEPPMAVLESRAWREHVDRVRMRS